MLCHWVQPGTPWRKRTAVAETRRSKKKKRARSWFINCSSRQFRFTNIETPLYIHQIIGPLITMNGAWEAKTEKGHLGDQNVDGRMTILSSTNRLARYGLYSCGLWQEQVARQNGSGDCVNYVSYDKNGARWSRRLLEWGQETYVRSVRSSEGRVHDWQVNRRESVTAVRLTNTTKRSRLFYKPAGTEDLQWYHNDQNTC